MLARKKSLGVQSKLFQFQKQIISILDSTPFRSHRLPGLILECCGKTPVISSLERVSRPGCRVYARKSEIPSVLGGLGICIMSTSQGLLTGKQAQEKGLGGEVLCTIS